MMMINFILMTVIIIDDIYWSQSGWLFLIIVISFILHDNDYLWFKLCMIKDIWWLALFSFGDGDYSWLYLLSSDLYSVT